MFKANLAPRLLPEEHVVRTRREPQSAFSAKKARTELPLKHLIEPLGMKWTRV